jgi:hypothetical protein
MPKPNEFKKIRTVTITKTHVETIYKALNRLLRESNETPEEKIKIQELIDRLEKQTKFKVECEDNPAETLLKALTVVIHNNPDWAKKLFPIAPLPEPTAVQAFLSKSPSSANHHFEKLEDKRNMVGETPKSQDLAKWPDVICNKCGRTNVGANDCFGEGDKCVCGGEFKEKKSENNGLDTTESSDWQGKPNG